MSEDTKWALKIVFSETHYQIMRLNQNLCIYLKIHFITLKTVKKINYFYYYNVKIQKICNTSINNVIQLNNLNKSH